MCDLRQTEGKGRLMVMKDQDKTKEQLIDELSVLRHNLKKAQGEWNNKKRGSGRLQDSEDWYQRLLKTMNEGFSIRDENTLFSYVNDKFCEMLGYKREELIGRPIEDFVDRMDANILNEQLEKRKRGVRSTYEVTWIKKDEKKLYTIMSAAPLFDDKGRFRGGFGAMTDITPRKLAEKKLITYRNKLRSLASEISLAEERERRRIAAELHDRIGQALAITRIKLDALRESATTRDLIIDMDEIRALIDQTIHDTRSLTIELSPPILYELGFEAAVDWLAEQTHKRHGIEMVFETDSVPKPLRDDVRVVLFKVVQELIFNVVKHAKAHTAKISLRRDGERIRIVVEDDGVGFDMSEKIHSIGENGCFGLFSIRERLESFGGRLEVVTEPGEGTQVIIVTPLEPCLKGEERAGYDH